MPSGAPPGHGYPYPPAGYRPAKPVGPGGAPLADFWQRLLAYLLDSLIVGAAMLVPMLILIGLFVVVIVSVAQPPDPLTIALLELALIAVILPLQLAVYYVYFVVMFHKTGQTVGKRTMKIRAVRATDGGPIDLSLARRRWLVQFVSAYFAPYFAVPDGLWQLWDQPYRQCLHDKCAGTVVVQVTV